MFCKMAPSLVCYSLRLANPDTCRRIQLPLGIIFEGRSLFRWLATDSSGGPSRERIRYIPFMIAREQADETYTSYHTEMSMLSAPLRQYQKVKEAFVPFWVVSATVAVSAQSAKIGYNRIGSRYNPATGRVETYHYTDYVLINLQQRWERTYSPEQLQMYAGSKYPSLDMEKLKPGHNVIHARVLTPEMMDQSVHSTRTSSSSPSSSTTGKLRSVYPFTMSPDTAINKALTLIRDYEESAIRSLVQQLHPGADQVTDVNCTVSLMPGFLLHPLFIPVYVFTLRTPILNLKMRTFVAAFQESPASGTRLYDEIKVGTLAAAVTPVVLLLLGIVWPWQRLLWLGSLLPGLIAGLAARASSDLRTLWVQHSTQIRPDDNGKQSQAHGDWDAPWVREYSKDFRDDQHQQQWQKQSSGRNRSQGQKSSSRTNEQSRGNATSSSRGDIKGYYKLLGVPKGASMSEVQAAFRAAALKNHPDHFIDEQAKKKATVHFQKLHEAYSTLRDSNKRRAYDAMS